MIHRETHIKKMLLITVSIIVAAIPLLFLSINFFICDNSEEVYEVTKASENLPIPTHPVESIPLSKIVHLRQLLSEKQFTQLNSELAGYQSLFEADQGSEQKVYTAYKTFFFTIPSYEDLFNQWIDAGPDKYQPYLAVAQYFYALGWESRGTKWAKDTSERQLQDMRHYLGVAEAHLKKSLEIKPNLMVAYHTLMGIYNATGNYAGEDWIITQTDCLFPCSYLMWSAALWAKQPRWGGSYSQMEDLAKQAEKYAKKNPRMSTLYGFIYYDQANYAQINEMPFKALELYDKALQYGGQWRFYYGRATVYNDELSLYDRALEDINKSIEFRPAEHRPHLMRSKINYNRSAYAESMNDVRRAEMITPGDSKIQEWKKNVSEKYRLIQ